MKTKTMYEGASRMDFEMDEKALETLNDENFDFEVGRTILIDKKTGTEVEINISNFTVNRMSMLAQSHLLDKGKSGRLLNIVE